jgi:hypothetical protein
VSALFLTIFFASIAFAGFLVWYFFFSATKRKSPSEGGSASPEAKKRSCPLCGEILLRGELVKSQVFPGKEGRLAHIFGCPYCYPANGHHPRICPVCRKILPPDSHLVAMMFERPGRKHVHVLGCTLCRKN